MNENIIYKRTRKEDEIKDFSYGKNKELSSFVGIRYEYENNEGKIYIHYPKTLGNLDATKTTNLKEHKELLLNLIKSLKLLKNIDYTNKTYDNRINEINIDKFPLYSYLWIWDDFKLNGRIIFSDYVNDINSGGRINWKKTIEGEAYYYNNNVYYTDIVYKKKIMRETLLTEIYDYCVYKSLEMIFFLTNLSSNFIHPIYKVLTNNKKIEYIECLKDTLESTFDDGKKLRYNHMLNIIEENSFDSLINKNVIGITSYASVFEKEIDLMLGNVKDISDYYPKAFNFEAVKKTGELLSSLRPDTINKDNDRYFVFDSKFYEFGDMPATESVLKQIAYGEYIETKKKIPADKIVNIFLIPRCFAEEGWSDIDIIKYQGYSESDWKTNTKIYEKIHIYFIDLKYVIKNYKNGYNNDLFDKIKTDLKTRKII